MKISFVTACLHFGFAAAKRTDLAAVRDLVAKLHPMNTGYGLIRLGDHGDGGYLVPDDLAGVVACFSPGVDNRASFEASLIERGIPCFLADGSVKAAPFDSEMVQFTKKFLGVVNNETTITLDDWVRSSKLENNGDLLLQMDIEGAEWSILLNVSRETLRRFRIIVIEFHDLERLMDTHAFRLIAAVFHRLLQDFYIVHNHPNNYGRSISCGSLVIPRVQEMTLIRRDRAKSLSFAQTFPHPLDATNDVNGPDLVLPAEWFHQKNSAGAV
ncbi:FkbM family methyltransferase [Bradyrhizobium sp. UFLA05-112]